MTLFQVLMLGAAAFFAYKIYEHIQTLQDPKTDEAQPQQGDIDPLIQEGDEALQKEELDKALAIYTEVNYKLQQHEQKDAEILFKIGYTLMQQKRYEEALEYYEEALELEPQNTAFHQAIASTYKALHRYDEAKKHLQHSLDIDANNPITYYNFGNLLREMGDVEEAKKMYAKALELDKEFKEAQEALEELQ